MITATRADTGWGRFRADFQAEILGLIPEHLERLSWSAERIEAAQRDGLRRLFAHAVAHSPFHRQCLSGTDAANIEPGDLASLPVMTKTDMMAAIDGVFTDRRLSLAAIEQALAVTGTEPVPVLDRYMALATGGSTGQRGVFVFDPAAKATFILSIIRSLLARLHAAGGIPPGGLPMAMVGAGSAVHATGAAAAETVGTDVPVRITSVPVTLPWPQIVDRLNALQPPALIGFASALARLAAEQSADRLHIAPTVIISTSETLLPEARAEITAAFGTPVIDSFATTEGLMGSSAPGGDVLMFNSDVCIIELVDARNRPVGPGVPSAKVLVTNLYNLAQPLIRYELADSFVRVPNDSGPGHLLARVQGRADEVFHYQAGDLHPHVVRSVMVQSP
jgi:phenylacetate-coenzyme A ligase PaaK-like adenylate-forming protein